MSEHNKLGEKILELSNVSVTLGERKNSFSAVDNVSFFIRQGEVFGLVGESGSGKTTIGRAIIRIHQTSNGEILYRGKKINGVIDKKMDCEVIKKIQMIFQDPMVSLNERAKVDYIVSEGLWNSKVKLSVAQRKDKVSKALSEVGLLPEFANRFPHEFSGGQRQRIGIARALIMEPEIIIADEPISALDISIRAQILNLLQKLKKERGLTYLFIAHDLSVMRYIADRIAVIYKGKIVEVADADNLFINPVHPYTKALLSAIPLPDPIAERKKKLLVYDPTKYQYDKYPPMWKEVKPKHFAFVNEMELGESY